MGEVHVLDAGLSTTIQDASGRPGLGRFGIPHGGALDAGAARLANRLVGNDGGEAVLEVTLHGPVLDWPAGAHVGLAGADLGATSDGLHLVPGHSYRLRPGGRLAFDGPRGGARAYLAVDGGFVVGRVLGSTSTDLRSGFGGFNGRPLRAGDVLSFGSEQSGLLQSVTRVETGSDEPLGLIPSPPGIRWFGPDVVRAFCGAEWSVSADSDRTGIRLTGGLLPGRSRGIRSLGVPVGAIQVPPGGEPIVTMVDGPVTGGYPLLGVIPRLDHARLAQAGPGARLRFRRMTVATARRLASRRREGETSLQADEGDFAAGWAR